MDWKILTVIFDKLFVAFVGVEAANVILVLPESPKRKNLRQRFQENGLERKLKEGEWYCFLSSLSKIADFNDPNDAMVLSSVNPNWLQEIQLQVKKHHRYQIPMVFHSPKLYFTFGPHG